MTNTATSAATIITTAVMTTSTRTSTEGKTSNVQAAFGSNASLKVAWCLNTGAQHHSYTSNEGVSELFQAMFLDSKKAKAFTCRKSKTSYFLKFGLAPYFKNKLIFAINNAGPFVLMFDESFNQSTTTKKKQNNNWMFWFWEAVFFFILVTLDHNSC